MEPDRKNAGHWYNSLSAAQRRNLDAVSEWLSPIPWQFFATLEFTWNVQDETAVAKLKGVPPPDRGADTGAGLFRGRHGERVQVNGHTGDSALSRADDGPPSDPREPG